MQNAGLSNPHDMVPPTRSISSPTPSRRSSGTFSQKTLGVDSATEVDNESTESDLDGSDGSGSEDVGTRAVIQLLDIRLLSIVSGDLDLAARLLPKIHHLLNGDDTTGVLSLTNSLRKNTINDQDDEGSKGKQRESESSASAPGNRNSGSGSSPRKHGRGSGDSSGRGQGSNSNKRPRRGGGGSSGNTPDGGPSGDPDEGPANDPGGSPRDDGFRYPDKSPGAPGGDPGDDPSVAESPGPPLNFACPFFKFDLIEFGPWTDEKYDKCPGSRIKELRHIK